MLLVLAAAVALGARPGGASASPRLAADKADAALIKGLDGSAGRLHAVAEPILEAKAAQAQAWLKACPGYAKGKSMGIDIVADVVGQANAEAVFRQQSASFRRYVDTHHGHQPLLERWLALLRDKLRQKEATGLGTATLTASQTCRAVDRVVPYAVSHLGGHAPSSAADWTNLTTATLAAAGLDGAAYRRDLAVTAKLQALAPSMMPVLQAAGLPVTKALALLRTLGAA